jgi:hypothetical protein
MQDFLKEFCSEDGWAEERRKVLKTRTGKANPKVLSSVSLGDVISQKVHISVEEMF